MAYRDDNHPFDPHRTPPGEAPRAEPEIIPPGAPDPRMAPPRTARDGARIWVSVGNGHTRRVHFRKPGPLALFVTLVALGLLTAATVVVFLGLFLLWLPVAGILVAGLVLSGFLRGYLRRLR